MEEVSEILLKINAITLRPDKPFRYVSGILSPIYTDNRLLMSHPEERRRIVDLMVKKIKQDNIQADVIAGIASSGICHAAWLSEKLDKPMIYVRKKTKDHGKENLIEGDLKKGAKVIIVEDLVSTGGSLLNGVKVIKEAGGDIDCCLVIFTYEMEKAIKSFAEEGVKIIYLTNFKTMIDVAAKNNYIKEEEKQVVLDWAKDTAGWGKKMGFE